jgi:chromosome segregation ATPase
MVDMRTSELHDIVSQYSESFRDLERVTDDITSQMERVSSSIEERDTQQRDDTSTDRQSSDSISEIINTSDIQRSLQDRVSAETEKIDQISSQIINKDNTLQEFSQQRIRDTIQNEQSGTQQNTSVDSMVGQTEKKISSIENDTENVKSIMSNVQSITSVVNDYLSTVREVMDSKHNEDVSRASEEVYSNNLMSEASDIFNRTSIPEGTSQESVNNYREETIKELIGKVSSLDVGNSFSTFDGQRLLKRDVRTLVNQYLSKVNRRART